MGASSEDPCLLGRAPLEGDALMTDADLAADSRAAYGARPFAPLGALFLEEVDGFTGTIGAASLPSIS